MYKKCESVIVLVNNTHSSGEGENCVPQMDNGPASEGTTRPQRGEQGKQQRANRPPPSRRGDSKPKEALVNGTTA